MTYEQALEICKRKNCCARLHQARLNKFASEQIHVEHFDGRKYSVNSYVLRETGVDEYGKHWETLVLENTDAIEGLDITEETIEQIRNTHSHIITTSKQPNCRF